MQGEKYVAKYEIQQSTRMGGLQDEPVEINICIEPRSYQLFMTPRIF